MRSAKLLISISASTVIENIRFHCPTCKVSRKLFRATEGKKGGWGTVGPQMQESLMDGKWERGSGEDSSH